LTISPLRFASLCCAALVALALASGSAHTNGMAHAMPATLPLVEGVKVLVLQTAPARVHLVVSGRKRAGADLSVSQRRDHANVVVTIVEVLPPVPPADLAPFTERIALDGAFPAGTYSLRVNDYSMAFEVM
jgi:hypothetical protein